MSVDADLVAMASARMSPASIAALMGPRWTAERVARRLAELATPAAPAPPAERICGPVGGSMTDSSPLLALARSAWQGRVVPPRKLRYCRWFLAAGWSLAQVAWLFDEEAEDLAAATE